MVITQNGSRTLYRLRQYNSLILMCQKAHPTEMPDKRVLQKARAKFSSWLSDRTISSWKFRIQSYRTPSRTLQTSPIFRLPRYNIRLQRCGMLIFSIPLYSNLSLRNVKCFRFCRFLASVNNVGKWSRHRCLSSLRLHQNVFWNIASNCMGTFPWNWVSIIICSSC